MLISNELKQIIDNNHFKDEMYPEMKNKSFGPIFSPPEITIPMIEKIQRYTW